MTLTTNHTELTTLQSLRAMMGSVRLTPSEALAVAEKQALKFLRAEGCQEPRDILERIEAYPWLDLAFVPDLPVSGATQLLGKRWHVAINQDDAATRQRFSLAHEFKHIIDHHTWQKSYGEDRRLAESVCDHFAGSLLMPRPWLKREWANGRQDVDDLAAYFGVSRQAMLVRLTATGLRDAPQRDSRSSHLAAAFWRRRRTGASPDRVPYLRLDPRSDLQHLLGEAVPQLDSPRGTTAVIGG